MSALIQIRPKAKDRFRFELAGELSGAPTTSELLRTLVTDWLKRELAEETERAESTAVQLKALESLVVKEYGEDEKTWPTEILEPVNRMRNNLDEHNSKISRITEALNP